MTLRRSALAWSGFALVLAGVVWLGPLMADQMTFFGDREQVADAAAARTLLPWPALLVAAGAAMLATWDRSLHAIGAALPLVAVALAWVMPDALFQLMAYFISAPIAVGSALAAALSLSAATRRPVVVSVIVVVAGVAILAAAGPVAGGVAGAGVPGVVGPVQPVGTSPTANGGRLSGIWEPPKPSTCSSSS